MLVGAGLESFFALRLLLLLLVLLLDAMHMGEKSTRTRTSKTHKRCFTSATALVGFTFFLTSHLCQHFGAPMDMDDDDDGGDDVVSG